MSASGWVPAYVGIGSNLDDPGRQVEVAIAALARVPDTRLVVRSGAWRNPPLGPHPQPDFVNAVAGLLTRLEPLQLLDELLAIERRQGRDRSAGLRWGPRRIDLDLLVHGEAVLDAGRLVLPHPRMASRNFVLFPLLEIAPGMQVPGLGSVTHLAAALRQEQQQEEHDGPWAAPVTSPSKAP